MSKTIRRLLIPLLAGASILALLTVTASVLVLYREAAALHPWAGTAVLVAASAGLLLAVVAPAVAVLRLPRAMRPVDPASARWPRYVRRYADRLASNPALLEEDFDLEPLRAALRAGGSTDELATLSEEALARLDAVARRRIRERAALVFAMTAVSQSGRLDTFVVLSAQLRLVREVAEIYLQRPGIPDLLRLYGNVGAAAFVAGEIQDSEILAVLGAPVSAAVTNLVPVQGTDPLISLLVSSLMDGSANGFLTLRIGALTRSYCQLRPPAGRRSVASNASIEAAAMLGGAVGDGAGRVARAVRKLVVRGAIEGTGRAARGLADAGADAVGRLGDLADRTARDIGRRLGDPPRRVLEQALRFWEGVARSSAADSSEVSGH